MPLRLCWGNVNAAAGIFEGGPLKPGGGATVELFMEESRCCWFPRSPEPVPLAAVLLAAAAAAAA